MHRVPVLLQLDGEKDEVKEVAEALQLKVGYPIPECQLEINARSEAHFLQHETLLRDAQVFERRLNADSYRNPEVQRMGH